MPRTLHDRHSKALCTAQRTAPRAGAARLNARLDTAASAQPSALASTAAPPKSGSPSDAVSALAAARGPFAKVSSQRQRFFTCSVTGGYCAHQRGAKSADRRAESKTCIRKSRARQSSAAAVPAASRRRRRRRTWARRGRRRAAGQRTPQTATQRLSSAGNGTRERSSVSGRAGAGCGACVMVRAFGALLQQHEAQARALGQRSQLRQRRDSRMTTARADNCTHGHCYAAAEPPAHAPTAPRAPARAAHVVAAAGRAPRRTAGTPAAESPAYRPPPRCARPPGPSQTRRPGRPGWRCAARRWRSRQRLLIKQVGLVEALTQAAAARQGPLAHHAGGVGARGVQPGQQRRGGGVQHGQRCVGSARARGACHLPYGAALFRQADCTAR